MDASGPPSASPSRTPRLDTTIPSTPCADMTSSSTAAPPITESARSGFRPLICARCFIVLPARSCRMTSSRSAGSSYPCSSRSGCSVRCMSIFARLRTVPPMPTRSSPLRNASISEPSSVSRTDFRNRLELRAGRRVVVEVPVAHSERTELERPRLGQTSIAEPRDLRAATADVQRGPAGHGEIVHGADEPQSRLGVAVDDLQRHAELSCAVEQQSPVERVADRRRRDREDPVGAGAFGDGAEVPAGPRACVRWPRGRARRRHGALARDGAARARPR